MKLNSSSELMVSTTGTSFSVFFRCNMKCFLSNYVSLLCPLTAHHMEGVCQHPSFRAAGSGRGLPETLQTAGERPLWGDGLWQDLIPAKQVRAQNCVLVGAQTVSVGWAWYLVQTGACSFLGWLLWWLHAVQSNYPSGSKNLCRRKKMLKAST